MYSGAERRGWGEAKLIVVADTTPLQYLILIQHEHVLPALYGRVVVPPAVISELSRDETPNPKNRHNRKESERFKRLRRT